MGVSRSYHQYLVVLADITVESTQQDHGDHEGQEEHDEHRVHDGEPVHLVGHRVVHRQIHVPAGRPQHLEGIGGRDSWGWS